MGRQQVAETRFVWPARLEVIQGFKPSDPPSSGQCQPQAELSFLLEAGAGQRPVRSGPKPLRIQFRTPQRISGEEAPVEVSISAEASQQRREECTLGTA